MEKSVSVPTYFWPAQGAASAPEGGFAKQKLRLRNGFELCKNLQGLPQNSKSLPQKPNASGRKIYKIPGQGQCTGQFLPANSESCNARVGLSRSIQFLFMTGRDKSKTWRATRKGWKHMGSLKQFISCLNILQEADLKPVSSLQAACAAMS